MKKSTITTIALSGLILSAPGCTTAPETKSKSQSVIQTASKAADTASAGGVSVDLAEISLSAKTKAKAEATAKGRVMVLNEAKSRAMAEAKAKAQAEAIARAKVEAEAEAMAQAKLEAEVEARTQAKLEAMAQAKLEAEAEAMAEAKAKAMAKAEADAKAKEEALSTSVVNTRSGQAIRLEESNSTGDAEKLSDNETFKAIVGAITPKDAVPTFMGKRFSLYLSEKVAFAQYDTEATKLKLDNARVHLGALYSERRDSLFQAGLAVDAEYFDALRLSFGTRAYGALLSTENEDVFAAAFGVEAAYNLPFESLPLELSASLYYSPDILNFGASDRVIDSQLDVAFPVRDHISLFAGIRFLQIDTRPEDREVDNRIHIGLRWNYE